VFDKGFQSKLAKKKALNIAEKDEIYQKHK